MVVRTLAWRARKTPPRAAACGDCGRSAQAGQGNYHFLALGCLQQPQRALIEPGIDPAENDSREGTRRQLDVLRLRHIHYLARVRQAGDRRLGPPVTNPAAATGQSGPQRGKARPRTRVLGSKARERVTGRTGRERTPPPGCDRWTAARARWS